MTSSTLIGHRALCQRHGFRAGVIVLPVPTCMSSMVMEPTGGVHAR